MTQVPIISGIYSDSGPALRTGYPVNIEPVPKASGISQGYLRTSEGMTQVGTGPGVCRGGIEWNGQELRVFGTSLCSVNGDVVVAIGTIEGENPVTFDYGFDYLAISGGGNLYLYDGEALTQNTDGDLGSVLDVVWIDGYYITTDGSFLVSTDLGNPFSVNPLKYASSEEDADPVVAVKKLGSELYAINRHTIETFTNTGGTGFPFQVIDGTQTYRGAVGTNAVTQFMGGLAFVGSGRNEQPAVHIAASGSSAPISTAEIESVLAEYDEGDLALTVCETRRTEYRDLLYVHLPDQTLVYDGTASQALGSPVWFFLRSTGGAYRARYFVWIKGGWSIADTQSSAYGTLDKALGTHWGDPATWEFSTPIIFNETNGMICHDLTLTGLTGGTLGADGAAIVMQFTEDGQVYSARRPQTLGVHGARNTPLKWTRVGYFKDQAAFRFSGDSNAIFSAMRLDAALEPLAW